MFENTRNANHYTQFSSKVAKRNKLTHRQKRQVGRNRSKKLEKTESLPNDDSLYPEQSGLVVGRFGQHADVRTEEDRVLRCHIRRTIESVVCGDEVLFREAKEPGSAVKGVVELVKPRNSLLTRPDFYDGIKAVAANIDQILIVSSIKPVLSTNIIDRYLVASEDVAIYPVILINKVDLLDESKRAEVEEIAQTYREIGYEVLLLSCKSGEGVKVLEDLLHDRISIFVGQSGVGKSSLVNALLPEAEELTNDISEQSGLGQHTTTSAKLLRFKHGGELIDSPGVREFALWHLPDDKVTWGFKEFRDYVGGCKFRDCTHLDDPGCIIRSAVENGDIPKFRYENYHSILRSMKEQRPNHSTPPVN